MSKKREGPHIEKLPITANQLEEIAKQLRYFSEDYDAVVKEMRNASVESMEVLTLRTLKTSMEGIKKFLKQCQGSALGLRYREILEFPDLVEADASDMLKAGEERAKFKTPKAKKPPSPKN